LPSFAAVAVCLLMAVPWRSSLLGTAALIAAQAPLAVAFPAADWPDAPAARQKEIIAVAAEGSAQLADRLDVAFDLEADSHRV
jgi:hypothetical protein